MVRMYTLEFYDKIRDIDRKYNFSKPISPQQALDIFNKLKFEIYPYGKVENPLSQFDNKDTPIGNFHFRLSSYNFIDFDKEILDDYLLELL